MGSISCVKIQKQSCRSSIICDYCAHLKVTNWLQKMYSFRVVTDTTAQTSYCIWHHCRSVIKTPHSRLSVHALTGAMNCWWFWYPTDSAGNRSDPSPFTQVINPKTNWHRLSLWSQRIASHFYQRKLLSFILKDIVTSVKNVNTQLLLLIIINGTQATHGRNGYSFSNNPNPCSNSN